MSTYKYPTSDDTRKCIANNPDEYVSFCVFNHSPLIDNVLENYGIKRCRPSEPLAPSAFTFVCSVDSHILTGLKPCTGNLTGSRCPDDGMSKSTRLVVDATVSDPTIIKGQYLFPKLTMPSNLRDLATITADDASPHFQGLLSVLRDGVRELVIAATDNTCDLAGIITEPSMAPRLAFFAFFIEVITFSELFHNLNMPEFDSKFLGTLAKNARDKFLSRISSQPVVNSRNFLANEIMTGSNLLTKNTAQLDSKLKSISDTAIRVQTAPVLQGKREDINERPSGGFVSPISIKPDCSIQGRNGYGNKNTFKLGQGPLISFSFSNPSSSAIGVKNESEA